MHDLRKSCDECNRAKRKCNGERPCSRCIEKEVDCTFSKRRVRTCTAYRTRRLRALASTGGAARHRSGPSDTALKRCRLSPSPATGLVGMHENLFLSDFFRCVGFFPLATQSDVREAMVKIMLSATATATATAARQEDCGEEDSSDAIAVGAAFSRAFAGGDHLPMGPSFCTFWCAVAMGALVKGRSTESVASYFRLARTALESYAGPTTAEVAKAWTILAYLHGMAGDQATFHEYLALSDEFVGEAIRKGGDDMLPVGFPEIVRHGETIKLFTGAANDEEVESFLSHKVSLPEISDFATEGELCRFIMQSYRAFEQAVHEDRRQSMFLSMKSKDVHGVALSVALAGDGSSAGSRLVDDDDDEEPGGVNPFEGIVSHSPGGRHCPGFRVRMKMELRGQLGWFGRLEEAVERPGIRAGVGGLVINGTLVFEKAAIGDLHGALERLSRCVEVFERYPGLHRFAMGEHMGHVMIQMAATIDDPRARGIYQRLRCAFNVTRPPGSLRYPPLEEWQGMSKFCDNLPCRSIPKIIAARQLASLFPPTPPWSEGKTTGGQGESKDVGSPAQLWTGSASRRDPHQAPDAFVETPHSSDESPLGCGGALASASALSHSTDEELQDSDIAAEYWLEAPGLVHAIDEELQDSDIAAEDWLEATRALGVALGIKSTI